MTTKDNQTVSISITVASETPAGQHWQGTVNLSGPFDEDMVIDAVRMSQDLTIEALGKGQHVAFDLAATVEQAVPSRPKRTRSARQVAEEIPKDQQVDSHCKCGPDGETCNICDLAPADIEDLPF